MGTTATLRTPQRLPDYHAAAERFGYRYRRIALARDGGAPSEERVLSSGFLAIEEVQPGLLIARSDMVRVEDTHAEAEMRPGLIVGVALAGPVAGRIDGAGVVAVPAGGAVTVRIDRPVGFSGYSRAGGLRHRMLSVFVRPEWLATHGLEHMLEPQAPSGVAVRHWSPSLRVGGLIEELMQPEQTGPCGRLLREALALALLAEATRSLSPAAAPRGDLRTADRQRMMRVRDGLVAAPEAAHTLALLARDAGVSASVLKDHFRRAFGHSVFAALRALRLDRAGRGLRDEGWTVAQAAHYAGFRHPTNFATAFRRRFGVPPRAFRQ